MKGLKQPLRKYQIDGANAVLQAWENRETPVYVAPTGSGKTKISSKILFEAGMRGDRLCFIVPRQTLVEQSVREFESWGMDVGVVAGGYPESRRSQLQVVSWQAMLERDLEWLQPKYTIIDEAHITGFAKPVMSWFPPLGNNQKRGKVLYLTATPRRMKKDENLGRFCDKIILAPSIGQLMKMGYLVRPSYNIAPNVVAGKMIYSPEYAFNVFNQVGSDLQTIVFPPSIAACKATQEVFEQNGVEAIAITDKTSIKLRQKAFERFHNEELKVLISCVVLREGFDSPKATHLIAGFDWRSHAAAVQMGGRILRTTIFNDGTPKTSAIYSDLCGIIARHGRLEHITYSEADLNLPDEEEKGKTPKKQCPNCEQMVFAPLPICPHCGWEFDIVPVRTIVPEGDLVQELTVEEQQQQKYYQQCLELAFQQKQRPKWASNRFKQKFGFLPPIDWRRSSTLKTKDKQLAIAYRDWLLASKDNSMQWVARQLMLEFDD